MGPACYSILQAFGGLASKQLCAVPQVLCFTPTWESLGAKIFSWSSGTDDFPTVFGGYLEKDQLRDSLVVYDYFLKVLESLTPSLSSVHVQERIQVLQMYAPEGI